MQFTGNPVAFEIFGLEIRWYAIFIVTGMILAVILADREARKQGFPKDTVSDLALFALPIGVIGARIWYVLFEWDSYQGDLMKMLNIRNGGLAIQGGIMAAVLVGLVYCKRKKLSFLQLADIIFPVVALAQGIGRWGNFTNNEAHGGPTDLPWGLLIHGQKVHPTFLYESLGDLLIFLLLWYLLHKKGKDQPHGQIACLYLILYGILRFFVEGFRTDSLWWGSFRVAQILAMIGVAIGFLGIFLLRRKKSRTENKKDDFSE